ncbi:SigB/SigF/SigG family RNA polymerase sigma factor [Streptomyces sp. 3MP-14]|uniref:SigB/SigF/SigG family RNA polymerase sigma factor n=1 Tax=Streptomyces mimosae TaxID=2586635 RepID=A0A5N6A8K8_9ACTN|nr:MULTISPECIES: SigB/SigF/SigG family RNA polymerase sigma factor [Streptomyces]KAB8163808.1 SigB/SigF/SigG family RNA polymerase sigma factor [Streptomyces mimosae]KAB8175251.1 SigB/SigF/SigG family RNA polymerase sigma factor [Streptomyces sp. 3MP-14]
MTTTTRRATRARARPASRVNERGPAGARDAGPGAAGARVRRRSPRPHDDAPDTRLAFERIAKLPEGEERDRLCRDVTAAWLPMAERLARGYRGRGESAEDLSQVAALGLVKAVRGFDPGRGHAFESYAVPTIVGEIRRHFRDHLWGVHVPRRTQELRNRVRSARHQLAGRVDDRPPDEAALAEASGLSRQEVRQGLAALDSFRPLSLDAELNQTGDGPTLGDTCGVADPGFDRVLSRAAVRPTLRRLPERDQRVLYLRYFHEMTQAGIAERLGVSQMQVSRLLSRIERDLRERLAEVGVTG